MTTTLLTTDQAAATLTQHPLGALLPAMTSSEYTDLRDDVARHGQRHLVIVFQGQVLDGWHRYRVLSDLGIEPRCENFAGDELDALHFVVSVNLRGRHLTTDQRAAIAVEIEKVEARLALERKREGGRKGRPGSGSHEESAGQEKDEAKLPHLSRAPQARDHAAAAVGVSPRTVATAKRIANMAPDVAAAVKAGRLDLATATAAAKLPERVRTDLLPRIDTSTTPAARKEARREIERASRAATRPAAEPHSESMPAHCDIRLGSVRDALTLPARSVDWVVTDPPYVRDNLDVWRDLGEVANHVLRPGGALIAMSGQFHLLKVT
ncbi:MAG: hypothetical protein M1522_02270, partial [Actinobacteria bacterium]|nr:hypothetical protein [Actinomycetota bacterium]